MKLQSILKISETSSIDEVFENKNDKFEQL